jgi:hypothetical protein
MHVQLVNSYKIRFVLLVVRIVNSAQEQVLSVFHAMQIGIYRIMLVFSHVQLLFS